MYQQLTTEAELINQKIDLSIFRNKSVLITGATGIIGIFFVLSLKNVAKENNISITAWINRDLPDFLSDLFDGITIIKGDICDIHEQNLPEFDCIIHSAGYGQPSKFLENEIKTIKINTVATEKLLTKLKKEGKFLFISSSEIYNGLDDDNVTENMVGTANTDHPRSCYIEGKRCGETICNAFRKSGTDVKIARLCLAYGPGVRVDDVRVINEFVKKGLSDGVITLRDSGSAKRTYCYVTDAVVMMWKILLNGKDTIYNIGGKEQISILQLANKIGKILNVPVNIPQKENPLIGNPKNVNVSCQKFQEEFGDIDFKSIDYGLEKTIQWIKNLI